MNNDDDDSRFDMFAFDADGMFYNRFYRDLLVSVIDRYADFFLKFGNKNAKFNEEELKQKEEISSQIIFEIYVLNEISEITTIYNHIFCRKINKAKEYLEKLKIYENIWSAIMHTLKEFVTCINHINPEILSAIFLRANRDLINHLCNKIEVQNIKRYAIVILSNRQSLYHDQAGMWQNGTGSIYLDADVLLNVMRDNLPNVKGVASYFCMADIYGNLKYGESYQKICEEQKNQTGQPLYKNHAPYLFDQTKFSLLYAIGGAIPRIAKEAGVDFTKCKKVNLYCYDDKLKILSALENAGILMPECLPEKVICELYHHDGYLRINPVGRIVGTGVVDRNYPENIKLMAKMCGFDLSDGSIFYNEAIFYDAAAALDFKQFLSLRVTGNEVVMYKPNQFATFFAHRKNDDEQKEELVSSLKCTTAQKFL